MWYVWCGISCEIPPISPVPKGCASHGPMQGGCPSWPAALVGLTTSSSNTQYVAAPPEMLPLYISPKRLLQNCLRHPFYCRLSYVGYSHTFLSVIQKMASFYFGKKYQLHLSLTTNSGLRHLIISFRLIYIMLIPLPLNPYMSRCELNITIQYVTSSVMILMILTTTLHT